MLKDAPIQKKLLVLILLISGSVSLLTCVVFFAYETLTFRQATLNQLSTLGEIIASNSAAPLAFQSEEDAHEILKALKAEPNIVSACLYDKEGRIFAKYPASIPDEEFPQNFKGKGFYYNDRFIMGFHPVIHGELKLGTFFIKSGLDAVYQRFRLYGFVAMLAIAISFLLAYTLSAKFQKGISKPILSLAETSRKVSMNSDYAVRAKKFNNDEIGALTDAFNKMLEEIQTQNLEITALNKGLEQKVKERTKKLEAANEELEAFSYSVSHDLRAPLRIINGYAKIFLEDYSESMDDEAKSLAAIISNNAIKMGQLIDDLLEFSRLGRTEIIKSKISMEALVYEVWSEAKRSEKHHPPIELIVHDLPDATADRVTIKQVWHNLISNAIKYSRNQKEAVIEIGCNTDTYYVKDNGAGFDMKYYNKLFAVFQRLHSHREFEGTGVGLAIVQKIISRHGGKIWAESKPGSGAIFYFTLG